jgi:hypothetical protein
MAGLEATVWCPGYVTRVTSSLPRSVGTHPLILTRRLPAERVVSSRSWARHVAHSGKLVKTIFVKDYGCKWVKLDVRLVNILVQRSRGQGPGSERGAVGKTRGGGDTGGGQGEGRCHPLCTTQISHHPAAAPTTRRLQRFQRGAVPWSVPPVRGRGPHLHISSRPLLSSVPWPPAL